MKSGSRKKKDPTSVIIVSANSAWNIRNFRAGLVRKLVREGYRIVIAVPSASSLATEFPNVELVDLAIDRSGLNPLADARLLAQYVRLFRRVRPDFYLGFTVKPNIYGSMAAAFTGVKSLPNVSGLGTAFIREGALSRFVGHLYRAAFRKAPWVLFQNGDDRRMFIERSIVRSSRALVVPGSGLDLEKFAQAPEADEGIPSFLFVGRLLADKGVREFVDAARMMKSASIAARFQILGSFDHDNRTAIREDEVGSWVNEGIVEYLGHTDDVRPFLRKATAVVLPSYREGLPRTLLEGAALGRPLIATDVPGCRELVVPGETGLLCDVRNARSLSDAMTRMVAMSGVERRAMGLAARRRVVAGYSEEAVVETYLRLLTQLRGDGKV